jgi:hypothetical protein
MRGHGTRFGRTAIGALAVVGVLMLASCSSDSGSDPGSSTTGATEPRATTTTTKGKADVERPDGTAAEIGEPLTAGRGLSLLAAAVGPDLDEAGYTEAEYPAAGTAVAYEADELPTDGTYDLTEGTSADYRTRIVVRRPKAAADFNGTVVVEWLNVSSGADVAPEYTYLAAEIVRGGYAWVGVSAQRIGIEGGPVAVAAPGSELTGAGKGIKAFDAARYGDLSHPGDAYSYDLFTQVGRAVRAAADGGPLDGLEVERMLAVGESQSAFALTTYADGVQPLTKAFDGFLIHSRGGAAAPLGKPGEGIDITGTIGGEPTTIRTDLDVPTIVVETESDVLGVLGYLPARQPDSDSFRLWEVAGTAHADAFQIGSAEELLGCTAPINRGQQSFVLKAALRHLDTWAGGGAAPPKAERLDVDDSGAEPAFRVDDAGNVTGGVRTPSVDAPVSVLSGLPVEGSTVICLLMGSTTELPSAALTTRYGDRAGYMESYEQAADDAIDAGFVLPEDREALVAESVPELLPG